MVSTAPNSIAKCDRWDPSARCARELIRQTLEPYAAPLSVTLATLQIDFKDIPEGIGGVGVTVYRAAVFEMNSCSAVTLQVTNGPTGGFGLPLGGITVVNPGQVMEGRIWISYTSTTAGSTASGSVTVHSVESNEDFVFRSPPTRWPGLNPL